MTKCHRCGKETKKYFSYKTVAQEYLLCQPCCVAFLTSHIDRITGLAVAYIKYVESYGRIKNQITFVKFKNKTEEKIYKTAWDSYLKTKATSYSLHT